MSLINISVLSVFSAPSGESHTGNGVYIKTYSNSLNDTCKVLFNIESVIFYAC